MSEIGDTSTAPALVLKERHNYTAFFLTFGCNLKCPYCINLHNGGSRYAQTRASHMDAANWIAAANRLVLRPDLPLTLQGGEPTLHKGFFQIVNEVKDEIQMDLLTNLSFDVEKFIKDAPVKRFNREAPYAPIRVSYHPGQNDIEELIKKTFRLQEAGFKVGLYALNHPDPEKRRHVLETQERCLKLGIDFRFKDFLGDWNGKLHGTYKYPEAICQTQMKACECRTSELICDPAGYVYRCHSDMYKGRTPIAHILDENFSTENLDQFRRCDFFGDCNPCDIKVKTNRFQLFGHTSVEIKEVTESQKDG